MSRAPSLARSRRARPRLEALECRLAPAFDLTIAALDATASVDRTTVNGVTTFSANDTGATVLINDVVIELQSGNDVVINTGSGGAESGTITWGSDVFFNFLSIPGSRSLTLTAAETIDYNGIIYNSFNPVTLDLNLNAPAVNVHGSLSNLTDVTVNATGGTASLAGLYSILGDVTVTANTITLTNLIITDGGNVSLIGDVVIGGIGNLSIFTEDVSQTDAGDVTITGTLNDADGTHGLTISAPGGDVTLGGAVGGVQDTPNLTITADSISLGGNVALDSDGSPHLTLTGDVTLSAAVTAITLSGGSGEVTIAGGLTVNGPLTVTLPGTTDSLSFTSGTTNLGANALSTNGRITVGGSFNLVTLAGSGTLSAAGLDVKGTGRLAPGGVGPVATLTVNGPVSFATGSSLLIDLGTTTSDRLTVSGAVTIAAGVELDGTGVPGPGPFTLLSGAPITGRFVGTGPGQVAVIGNDAFTTSYTPIGFPMTLTIALAPAGPSTVTGATPDGSLYTIKLLGPATASLVVSDLGDGTPLDIVVRNSTPLNSLTITVNPNGGSGFLDVDALRVNGPINAITAPAANLDGDARVTGLLKSLTLGNLRGSLVADGLATEVTTLVKAGRINELTLGSKITTLQAVNVNGAVKATTITTLKVGDFHADLTLTAASAADLALSSATIAGNLGGVWDVRGKIGKVTVGGGVFNATIGTSDPSAENEDQLGDIASFKVGGFVGATHFNSVGRIGVLSSGAFSGGGVRAKGIGTLTTVPGAAFAGVSGFNLVLDAGSPTAPALTSATFAGIVTTSTWDVRGTVGTVTARRGAFNWAIGTLATAAEFEDQMGGLVALKVSGEAQGVMINSSGRVGAVTADQLTGSFIRAASLGKLTVGTAAAPGRYDGNAVTLLSNGGGRNQNAIDSVLIHGIVSGSTFLAPAGNVGSFTVGRFDNSRLYVGFTPGATLADGTFTGAFSLTSFKTTQAFVGGLSQTLAFRGSEVAANRFGTVRLSGVLAGNGGILFGLRVNGAANRGSVRVAGPNPPFPPNADLMPGFSAADFRFLA